MPVNRQAGRWLFRIFFIFILNVLKNPAMAPLAATRENFSRTTERYAMKHLKDRRAPWATALFPFRDNADKAQYERRRTAEASMEKLGAEERQLLFSEMPAPIPDSDED